MGRKRVFLGDSLQGRLGNWARRTYVSVRYTARKKDREFAILVWDLLHAFPKDWKCPALCIPLCLDGPKANRPSVDRLDSTKGYVRGNIAIISWRANLIKRDATLAELTQLSTWLKVALETEACKKHAKLSPRKVRELAEYRDSELD